jgi:transcriptional regulator with GAF, ATPase, and Fis domain
VAIPAVTAAPTGDETAMPTIAAQERRMIVEVLQRTHGHQKRAAALLGLPFSALRPPYCKRYQIEVTGGVVRT